MRLASIGILGALRSRSADDDGRRAGFTLLEALVALALLLAFACVLIEPRAVLTEAAEIPRQTIEAFSGHFRELLRHFFQFVDQADVRTVIGVVAAKFAALNLLPVPILNGNNHDEELIFTAGLGVAVSGGAFVGMPVAKPVTPDGYLPDISAVLGVSDAQAAAIAAQYPLSAYPLPDVAFETLVSDANFACPALQVDRWTSRRAPTFAYEFDDLNAPGRFAALTAATHSSELQYLFDQPNTPLPGGFTPDQQALAQSMRAEWVSFAADGAPAAWPAFNRGEPVMSLVPPQPRVGTGFADAHHCDFWSRQAARTTG